ncbi:transglutaminase family protein [Paeniroseomonas aquatica]|uniref:Transglutaminase family protein n=2 Tax=Paeniroseomonas aquatica TaxID=373043 RepID=A0ABT8AEL1_9PROT|nr:transglutaminase family protein [Paeniroseomonas aquatica]MDN3568185.1 transglutaminase family protein [Paeniroseomonas aquatica]
MIYRVRHTTRYAYGSTVDLAAHLLHLTPRALPGQRVLEAAIIAEPAASRLRAAIDHFGNHVTWLFVDTPHAAFEVTGDATVEVGFALPPPAAGTLPWEEVAALARAGGPAAWQAAEFTFESPMVQVEAAAGEYAAASFPPGRPVLEGLLELNARIRRELTYRSGVTDLATPVREVLRRREGVCQDFSHLMISALRALGLPARYVSGYIRTYPPPGQPRRRGTDQSHAWVGAWLGPAHGWVDLDPTNGVVVREEHLVVGWGRDYADVSPVSGVVLGGGAHRLSIAVDLEPLEATAGASG